MERLDVMFANRYLTAMQQYRAGERPSRCWLKSFVAADARQPIILQHLLLGMNAHINLDLGIAAAGIAPGSEVSSLEHDFDEINLILAGLVGQVQTEIYTVSPWMHLLGRIDPRADVAVTNFSMEKARTSAWDLATRLAVLDPQTWTHDLEKRDEEATLLADLVRHPSGLIFWPGLAAIRSRESRNVVNVIDALTGSPAQERVTHLTAVPRHR